MTTQTVVEKGGRFRHAPASQFDLERAIAAPQGLGLRAVSSSASVYAMTIAASRLIAGARARRAPVARPPPGAVSSAAAPSRRRVIVAAEFWIVLDPKLCLFAVARASLAPSCWRDFKRASPLAPWRLTAKMARARPTLDARWNVGRKRAGEARTKTDG